MVITLALMEWREKRLNIKIENPLLKKLFIYCNGSFINNSVKGSKIDNRFIVSKRFIYIGIYYRCIFNLMSYKSNIQCEIV